MRPTFDKWLVIAAGAMLALLLANFGQELYLASRLYAERHEVLHSRETLAGLDSILSLAKDAETGQRGYLITGERRYLEPFDSAVASIERQIDAVERLTADNPSQQAQLRAVRDDVMAKLAELREAIELRASSGAQAARAVLMSDRGKALMDSLRARIAEMTGDERQRLAQRHERAERGYRTTQLGTLLGGLAVGVAALALFLLLRHQERASASAAATIAEQAERLRTTLASIGDGVIATDIEARVTNLNPVAESLTGWSRDAALGQPLETVFRIVNEDTRASVDNPATRALRDGIIVGLANHTLLIARDGSERPIDDSAAPIRCADGEVVGCVLVFRDVSERRQAEREAQGRQRQLRLVTDNAPVSIAHVSAERRYRFVNRPYAALFDAEPQQLVGRHLAEVIGEPAYAKARPHVDAVLRGEPIEYELELPADTRHPLRWLHVAYQPERDDAGRVVGFVAGITDITARKLADRQLHEGGERLRLAMEAASMGSWQWDVLSNEMLWSTETYKLFGVPAATPLSIELLKSCLHPDDRPSHWQATQAALRSGYFESDYRVVRSGGDVRWVASRGRLVDDERGAGSKMVGVVSDITERVTLQQALRDADRRKDEFLATLAHELRNPLAPIRNGLAVMKLAPDNPQALRQTRQMMERQLDHLVRLVDDLFDVSRISQGKLQLRRGRIELASVIHSAIEACRPLTEASGHQLGLALPAQPVYLDADPVRLAQVFSNLINNACKYTERGGRLGVRAERIAGEAVVTVSDNGVGIPSEQLGRIFEMFSQLDSTLERSHGGLGIGLSLVRRLVELHGGRIEAHSAGPGHGAEFAVRLPVALARPQPPQAAVPEHLEASIDSRRILIVDDNADSADSMAALLAMTGHETHTAGDGLAAIEAAGRLQPDVILLDIGLPGLNGYEVCARLRGAGNSDADRTIIVALSGWGQEDDVRRAREAGFDGHLVKPADFGALTKLLASLQAERKKAAPSV